MMVKQMPETTITPENILDKLICEQAFKRLIYVDKWYMTAHSAQKLTVQAFKLPFN